MSEQISALMDGELGTAEANPLLATIRENKALRQDWNDYHLIGDVLRQTVISPTDLADKISVRLKSEPTVLAPHKFAPRKREFIALSVAASFAAVALVALSSLKFSAIDDAPDNLAAQSNLSSNTSVASQSNPSINEYLVAHQEFSPGTALLANSNFAQVTYTKQQDKAR